MEETMCMATQVSSFSLSDGDGPSNDILHFAH